MLQSISDKINILKEEDRRMIYEAEFTFRDIHSVSYSALMDIVSAIPARDKISIYLSTEAEDYYTVSRNSSEEEYLEFIENTYDGDSISAKLEIKKAISDEKLSIYNFQSFSAEIISLSIEEVMRVFARFFRESSQRMIFELFDFTNIFYTKTMCFIPHGNMSTLCEFDRKRRLQECRETSYFYNMSSYELLPDDFKIEVGYANNPFAELFSKLATILSTGYIASNFMLQTSIIQYQIMGQRSVDYAYRYDEIRGNSTIYRIYDWIYSGGNSIDKAIIARNIICLHCKYEPLLNMDEKVMSSIQSNYNLYLKDNVTQYLELKNKVAEYVCDIVSRTGEYATELLDRFKTNMIAIFGFLFSVVIANIVSAQPVSNIFTRDITAIMEVVLAGSLIYLFICYKQSKYQIEKVYDSYNKLKTAYQGILDHHDIQECFDNDSILNEMKKTIERSQKNSLFVWICILIVLFVAIEAISASPVVWPIIEIVVNAIGNTIKSLIK